MKYKEKIAHFKDLSASELYAIMKARSEVFIVEQDCAYQDQDNKDLYCHHLWLADEKEVVAYARLVPPGLSYDEMSIGRVLTTKAVRGTGAGKMLMQLAISHCYRLFGNAAIRIGAQLYAEKFYESLGFVATGEIYYEDRIEHIQMVRYPEGH